MKLANLAKFKDKFYMMTIVAVLTYLIGTFISFFIYTGGYQGNPTSPGYSFVYNAFSDLGLFTAISGNPNLVSAVIYMVILAFVGIALLGFFIFLPAIFRKSRVGTVLSIIGSGLGIWSSICLVGIAFTPADLFNVYHLYFSNNAFMFSSLASLLYGLAIIGTKRYPTKYSILFLAFGVCVLLYGMIFIPESWKMSFVDGLLVRNLGQKIVVYLWMITDGVGAYVAWKLVKAEKVAVASK
nr:hypothetical protein [Candidatus Sigynarchaeota archaeon]